MFYECAGIHQALEVYKFNLSVDLAKMYGEDKIKNNIKFIKDDKENKKRKLKKQHHKTCLLKAERDN